MATEEPQDGLDEELRRLDKEIAGLRQEAEQLRTGLADHAEGAGDLVDEESPIEMAEEQEAVLATLEARREEVLRELGRT